MTLDKAIRRQELEIAAAEDLINHGRRRRRNLHRKLTAIRMLDALQLVRSAITARGEIPALAFEAAGS